MARKQLPVIVAFDDAATVGELMEALHELQRECGPNAIVRTQVSVSFNQRGGTIKQVSAVSDETRDE